MSAARHRECVRARCPGGRLGWPSPVPRPGSSSALSPSPAWGSRWPTASSTWPAGICCFTLFFTMITSLILGMGVPDDRQLHHHLHHRRPCSHPAEGAPSGSPHVRLLLRDHRRPHPSGGPCCLCRAGIARADPMKTGFIATKLAIGAFLVPYIFVYNPAMLLIGITPFGLIQNLVTACCGMFGAGVAMIGYFRPPCSGTNGCGSLWAVSCSSTRACSPTSSGIGLLAACVVNQYRKKKAGVLSSATAADA